MYKALLLLAVLTVIGVITSIQPEEDSRCVRLRRAASIACVDWASENCTLVRQGQAALGCRK